MPHNRTQPTAPAWLRIRHVGTKHTKPHTLVCQWLHTNVYTDRHCVVASLVLPFDMGSLSKYYVGILLFGPDQLKFMLNHFKLFICQKYLLSVYKHLLVWRC